MVIEPPLPDDPAPNDPSATSLANSMADVDALPPVTDESGEQIDPAAAFGESPVMRAKPVAPEFKGDKFDFTPFNAIADAIEAGDMDAARKIKDQLTPVQQHVLERASMMEAYTPERAAADATSFMDLQAKQKQSQQDPAKARESAQQAARVQSVIGIMDTYAAPDSDLESLVGPAAGSWAANEWDKWNNPDQYSKRFDLSFTTKSEVLEAAKFVKPLSNDERKFLEEMFPRRDDPPQVWRSYFKRTRDILSQGLPQQPQQQGAAPATAPAPQGAAPQPPNLPPTRIDPVTGQTMQLIQNQQGRWVYRMATQQQSQPNVTGR